MAEINARRVEIVGGGTTEEGEHGAIVFAPQDGEQFALVFAVEQFASLVRAAALLHTQALKLRGDEVPAIPVEEWDTKRTSDSVLLTLKVFGGLELRFEVSKATKGSGAS